VSFDRHDVHEICSVGIMGTVESLPMVVVVAPPPSLALMLPGIETNAWFSVHNRFCYISCSAYFFCVFICVLIMRLSNVKAKRRLDISDDD
jgi:hypothetical protein